MARMVLQAVLFSLLAAGCGTQLSTTMLNPSPRSMQPRTPAEVELFTSGAPPRPHVDVAYFEAEQESEFSVARTQDFLGELRARAAAMGCDAVVIGGLTNRGTLSINLKSSANIRGMTATCIVYTGPFQITVSAP